MLGKEIRIERMKTSASGRIFTIAVDHAPSYGVLSGIEDIQAVVDRVAGAGALLTPIRYNRSAKSETLPRSTWAVSVCVAIAVGSVMAKT